MITFKKTLQLKGEGTEVKEMTFESKPRALKWLSQCGMIGSHRYELSKTGSLTVSTEGGGKIKFELTGKE